MNDFNSVLGDYKEFLILLVIWGLIWKGLALWRAAKNDSKGWFIALLLLNTAGILPIAYLIYNRYKNKNKLPK